MNLVLHAYDIQGRELQPQDKLPESNSFTECITRIFKENEQAASA